MSRAQPRSVIAAPRSLQHLVCPRACLVSYMPLAHSHPLEYRGDLRGVGAEIVLLDTGPCARKPLVRRAARPRPLEPQTQKTQTHSNIVYILTFPS